MSLAIYLAQQWILTGSEFSWSAAWMGLSIMIYKLKSSAKILLEEFMSSTMPLIYKRNRRGPWIEPCETPALTEVQEELAPGKTTLFPVI